jgi:hypothetical protein
MSASIERQLDLQERTLTQRCNDALAALGATPSRDRMVRAKAIVDRILGPCWAYELLVEPYYQPIKVDIWGYTPRAHPGDDL